MHADRSVSAVILRVNGQEHRLDVDNRATLLDVLRNRLDLTGSKEGCDHGQCGACTVLLDGLRTNSCLQFAVAVEGREVTTVEGLAAGDRLHPVQQAFLEEDGFQCGYCTQGQICSAVAVSLGGRPAAPGDAAVFTVSLPCAVVVGDGRFSRGGGRGSRGRRRPPATVRWRRRPR